MTSTPSDSRLAGVSQTATPPGATESIPARILTPSHWVVLEYATGGVAARYVERAAEYDATFRAFLRRLIASRLQALRQVSLVARRWHEESSGNHGPLELEVVPPRKPATRVNRGSAASRTVTDLGWLSPVQARAILLCSPTTASIELLADPERIVRIELGARVVPPSGPAMRWRARIPHPGGPIPISVWADTGESFRDQICLRPRREPGTEAR